MFEVPKMPKRPTFTECHCKLSKGCFLTLSPEWVEVIIEYPSPVAIVKLVRQVHNITLYEAKHIVDHVRGNASIYTLGARKEEIDV